MPIPTTQTHFQDLVLSVGDALPGHWSITPHGEENWACTLYDPDTQLKLFFRPDEWANATKIEIKGVLPKDSRGQEPYLPSLPAGNQGKMPSIKVSGNKTPKQIALDIERRLIPEYAPLVEEALTRIAQSETYYQKVGDTTHEIASLLGVKVKSDAKTVSFYHSPYAPFAENIGSATVSDNEVDLELHLAPDTAVAVLSFLKKRGG